MSEPANQIQRLDCEWDDKVAAHEKEAKEELRDLLFSMPRSLNEPSILNTLELYYDNAPHYFGNEWSAYVKACTTNDDAEIGWLVRRAQERAAEQYVESEPGVNWVKDRIQTLSEEN